MRISPLRLTPSCLLLAVLTVATASEASASSSLESRTFVATAQPRTLPLIHGQDAWYEVTIRNAGSHEEIIDLGAVRVTGFIFVGSKAVGGPLSATVDDKISPQRCSDVSAFAIVKSGAAVTTLVQVKTPDDYGSLSSVELRISFGRITNLADCTPEMIQLSTKPVRIQSRPAIQK
jgi:hypothetical protein